MEPASQKWVAELRHRLYTFPSALSAVFAEALLAYISMFPAGPGLCSASHLKHTLLTLPSSAELGPP